MLIEIRMSNSRRTDLPQVSLPLFGQTRFPISFVDGLGPVKAEISSSPYSNLDEDHFQSSRVGTRNIVLTLELVPSYHSGEDPEDLRSELYGYLSPKSRVDLEFHTTKGVRHISGVVEAFESPLFVQVPAVQVSILCHNPFFTSGEIKTFSTTVPYGTNFDVVNEGTADTGLALVASMSTTGTEFIFSNHSFSDERPLHLNYIFDTVGDSIRIDTNPRQKQVTLLPNVNLLPYTTVGSGWPRLQPGANSLSLGYTSQTGTVIASIEFMERFVGL